MPGSRIRQAASCTICVVLAFFFASIGLAKLIMPGVAQRAFVGWGHPDWFYVFVGALEVMGAVLLLSRRTATLAAAILAGLMLGAIATHLRSREFVQALLPCAVLIPIAGVGYCRRLDATWMRRLASRRRTGSALEGLPHAPTTTRRPDPSRGRGLGARLGLRIPDRGHADIPEFSGEGAERQRQA